MKNSQLPSPLTYQTSTGTEPRDGTETPPEGRPSQIRHRTPVSSPRHVNAIASPPAETQQFSQIIPTRTGLSSQVKDEEGEGVWGYLIPLDDKFGGTLVLRERSACPVDRGKMMKKARGGNRKDQFEKQEAMYEATKINGIASGGYLIGRHPECGTSS